MIHTTIGVYANGDFKINGVKPEHLDSHIEYNKTMRFGRALFVDGICHNQGYLSPEECKEWEAKIQADPKRFTRNKCTAPYV